MCGDRVWCDGAELTGVQVRALAARLAAISRVRQEAELRAAHPVGSRVWIRGSRVPHTVTGSTDSPGLAPALRLSGGVIARSDQVTRTPPA